MKNVYKCNNCGCGPCKKSMTAMRDAGYNKGFMIYVLAKDVKDQYERIKYLQTLEKELRVTVKPFVMPYRDFEDENFEVDKEVKRLARWCNRMWIYRKITFEEYCNDKN